MKDFFKEEVSKIKEAFFSNRDGLATVRAMSALMDRVLRDIYRRAADGSERDGLALVALGGYGRSELHPVSDVDLMFLSHEKAGKQTEDVIKSTLHPLWDMGLNLGHTIRELEECRNLDLENIEFSTALLDSRYVAGDETLFARLKNELLVGFLEQHREPFIKALLDLADQRHKQFSDTIYQLEPDVKEAPGNLRDLHVGLWLAKASHRIQNESELVEKGVLSRDEFEALMAAKKFLLSVRNYLHFITGRNKNILSYELQECIAQELGYRETPVGTQVENFMRDYFLQVKVVYRFLSRMIKLSNDATPRYGTPVVAHVLPAQLEEGFLFAHDSIDFEDPNSVRDNPCRILKIFFLSQKYQIPIGDPSLKTIQEQVQSVDTKQWESEECRDLFFSLLRRPKGLYACLSLMHEVGVLGSVFPEFELIRCRVIRDFYHKYTIDEHSLLAVKNIEDLYYSTNPSDQKFKEILSELENPEILIFSLLFHDVGKCEQTKSHVLNSVKIVEKLLKRTRIEGEGKELIKFLIKNHLQMSEVFLKRDISDEEAVKNFADLVATPEHLKMLCLFTYADIKAVSPGTLTPWKQELLWQLYVKTYNELTRSVGDERWEKDASGESEIKWLLNQLPAHISVDRFESFIDGFPRRYLKSNSKARIIKHFTMSERLRNRDIELLLSQHGELYELCILTADKPFLFSEITGTLSYFGANIIKGDAFSNSKGIVLDLFQFSDERKAFKHKSEVERFKGLLTQVIRGEKDISELLRNKENSVLFQKRSLSIPTVIHFDNDYSKKYTILEIVSQDRVGLLFKISRAISEHRCNIDVALISTEGNKAIDVFYLLKRGEKIDLETRSKLTESLAKALE